MSKQGHSESITHYIIGKTLGQGTFGKVKLGLDLLTHQQVAIKILSKATIKQFKDEERVEREITILKQVRHDNII